MHSEYHSCLALGGAGTCQCHCRHWRTGLLVANLQRRVEMMTKEGEDSTTISRVARGGFNEGTFFFLPVGDTA